MNVIALLTAFVLWHAPEPAYGPRPWVLPVVDSGGGRIVFVRESWQGDQLWLRAVNTSADSAGHRDASGEAREQLLWSAQQAVIDEIRWSGEEALLVRAHGRGRAPALWWLGLKPEARASGMAGPADVPVEVRALTPTDWPEGERRGAAIVDVRESGEMLLTLDRRVPYQPDLFRWSPQRTQPRVAELNPGDVVGWRSDYAGTPRLRQRFRVLSDSIEYRWEWREEAYGEWKSLDAWRLDEPAWRPLRFDSEDDLWVSAETARRDTFGLHRLGLTAGALGAPTVSSSAADMAQVWWSASAGGPALVEWHSLLPGQRALLPQWQQWQERLQAHAPDSHWLLRQVDETAGRMLVTEIDGRSPRRWWRYAADEDRLEALGAEWPPAGADLPALRAMRWTSADGLPLTAYFQPALAGLQDEARTPLVVLVHGGPWARDRYDYDPLSAVLARSGIAVLKVNFRGSSGLGRGFLMASRGEWGRAMQDDVLEGIAQVNARGWADSGRVCVAGMSYGGYAALQMVLTQPERFRCAMAHAAVTDLTRHIQWLEQRGDRLGAAEWRALVGDPASAAAALTAASPLSHAATLRRPVLLSHASEDGVVLPAQSRVLWDQARSPLWHWLEISGGHRLERAGERQQLWNAWRHFLAAYLLDQRPAPGTPLITTQN